MARLGRRRLAALLAAGAGTLAASAHAHIDLRVPVPREQGLSLGENANLKIGPCGQVENGRSERVTVFAPGETIEVTWEETTNHRSYYRVAFDRDGDDAFPVFPGPGIGAEGIDPRGLCPVDGEVVLAYELEDGAGGIHTLRVSLPDVECERCTLQVVQYMFDRMRPYYFQCADLALRRQGTVDAGVLDAGVDAARAASSGAEPRAAAGCSSRISPSDAGLVVRADNDTPAPAAAAPDTGANGMQAPPAQPSDVAPAAARRGSSGCNLGAQHQRGTPVAMGLLYGAAIGWRRARHRRADLTRLVNAMRERWCPKRGDSNGR
jgi:hypothetical protein